MTTERLLLVLEFWDPEEDERGDFELEVGTFSVQQLEELHPLCEDEFGTIDTGGDDEREEWTCLDLESSADLERVKDRILELLSEEP